MAKTTSQNYCPGKGYLVAGNDWIPDALFDYQATSFGSTLGCNQIFCSACNHLVKQKLGWFLKPHHDLNLKERSKFLYSTSDWVTLDFLLNEESRITRFYYCECHSVQITLPHALDGSTWHEMYSIHWSENWACHGHPPLQIPTEIYGLQLETEKDIEKIIEAIINQNVTLTDTLSNSEVNPEAFMISRLFFHLQNDRIKDRINQTMSNFLHHPNPLYRSIAISFADNFPDSKTTGDLAATFKKQPELFQGVSHPHRGKRKHSNRYKDLDAQVLETLLKHLCFAKTDLAQSILRKNILNGNLISGWGRFGEELGLDWIEENMVKIFSLSPDWACKSIFWTLQEKELPFINEKVEILAALGINSKEKIIKSLPIHLRKRVTDQN